MSVNDPKPVPRLTPEQLERFHSHVPNQLPDDACWEWQGSRLHGKSYGRLTFDGETHLAHRLAYSIKHNDPLAGILVLHTCDNPPCVNWRHLFKGTPGDNTRDRDQKGRHHGPNHPADKRGAHNGRAKLTEEAVRKLRERRKHGATLRELSREFSISLSQAAKVANGEFWAHVH